MSSTETKTPDASVKELAPDLRPDTNPAAPATSAAAPETTAAPRRRGFASMDPARVKEIARRGGKAAHEAGTAHEFTSEEARAAGRKGGQTAHANRRKRLDQGPQNPQK